MLSQEQVKEALVRFRTADYAKRRSESCAKLPAGLRETGRALAGCDAAGKQIVEWVKRTEAVAEAAGQLDALSARERRRVFEALFPALAVYVEAGWELMKGMPYQGHSFRKPFRAPHAPEATLARRGHWLDRLLAVTQQYEQPVRWFAEWAAYVDESYYASPLGILFAAAIDSGGDEGKEVFDILVAGAKGEHEVAQMGRHVVRALLLSSREDGWEFMERILLAAQRQEGLRQSILETIDESHPQAFRRMIRLVLDENLVRFAAAVRAVDVWLGLMWDSASAGAIAKLLGQVSEFLEKSEAIDDALRGDDAEAAYLALWSIAFDDADRAIPAAAKLLRHRREDMRFAAAVLLARLERVAGLEALLPALADADLRVAAVAAGALANGRLTAERHQSDVFERLEQLRDRFPQEKTRLAPLLWPWYERTIHRGAISGALLNNLGNRPIDRILPYIRDMDVGGRAYAVHLIGKRDKWDAATRKTLFALVGDPSETVRSAALQCVGKCKVTEAEAKGLEGLLTRKSGDLRRGVIAVLLAQPDAAALASADRLLAASDTMPRQAGLEMLRAMVEGNRAVEACRQRGEQYAADRKTIPAEERKLLDPVLDAARKAATLDDALGLMDPRARAEIPPVRKLKVTFVTKASQNVLYALDDLVRAYRESPVEVQTYDGRREQRPLGGFDWWFPSPSHSVPLEEDLARLPLREVWTQWLATRSKDTRDADGLELLRARATLVMGCTDAKGLNREGRNRLGFVKLRKIEFDAVVRELLLWLTRMTPVDGAPDALLDLVETSYALVPEGELRRVAKPHDWQDHTWRSDSSVYSAWRSVAGHHLRLCADQWTPEHKARLWRLDRWRDEPVVQKGKRLQKVEVGRDRADVELLASAYEAGVATEADVYDHLLGPRTSEGYGYGGFFGELQQLTRKKPCDLLKAHPWLGDFAERCRRRILEVELERGDTPTAASQAAACISSIWGVGSLVRVLTAIGKDGLHRGWSWGSDKKAVLSRLLRVTIPEKGDTVESLSAAVREGGVSEGRLLEVAVYAPQWAGLVEGVLRWNGLEDAVWWIHAHTKDPQWRVEADIREIWAAEISQRTPLSPADLLDGAVDVEWFHRVYRALKPARWKKLDAAAKYASGGGGHKRAQLFAEAMLGRAKKAELVQRIDKSRHQDAVRALGLLPLARGKARERDLLDRYRRMQEFIRTSRQFGSQRQASEKRAAAIGQANLARTAGYKDPIRLQWAMEAQAVADLADGPIELSVEDTSVTLAVDEYGAVELAIAKAGKPLKNVPKALKSNKQFKALLERRKEIKRQVSRIRPSLEQMMCRGETATGTELGELMRHPLIDPMLGRLVLVGDGVAGYPDADGKLLRDHSGNQEPVKSSETLRIAHPHDLREGGQWHLWQRDCFDREIVQPFKQVFRELYPLSKAEEAEKTQSRRYAGQQVNPRQALALLGSRQWINVPEEGVLKTFHEEDLSARLEFQEAFFTPADIDGLTLESVSFSQRGKWEVVPLAKVPPRVFSEVMRDLDLVVSVAHRGGVDPEASASTVEMRSDLLRETLALVDVENVRIEKNHAFVDGQLGRYSVHLGSAVTHKLPGGALLLVPVHSQHRGRMFLPFADDDPKTAEVISKVLLLARDTEIQDPNILDQLRRTG